MTDIIAQCTVTNTWKEPLRMSPLGSNRGVLKLNSSLELHCLIIGAAANLERRRMESASYSCDSEALSRIHSERHEQLHSIGIHDDIGSDGALDGKSKRFRPPPLPPPRPQHDSAVFTSERIGTTESIDSWLFSTFDIPRHPENDPSRPEMVQQHDERNVAPVHIQPTPQMHVGRENRLGAGMREKRNVCDCNDRDYD